MSKLPILMYHSVSLTDSEGLTISTEKLEEQFKYLVEKKYRTYHFKELMDIKKLAHRRNIVITFDDGYVNQMELAIPLLEKYDLKATFFVPLAYIGKTDEWNTSSLEIMTSSQLKMLDPTRIELAYHSFYHKFYTDLSPDELDEDTQLCFDYVSENGLSFASVLAYTYGKFPRKSPEKEKFIDYLVQQQFVYATRIGNRINRFPFEKPFEIQRIDVKGEFGLSKFKRKIKFGKLF